MGRWHVRELRRAGADLVAVADPRPDAARRLAPDGTLTFSQVDDLLAGSSPDVVHVCVPLAEHVAVARACLAAGAHVLVEKPLAPSAPETRALLAEAAAAGRRACPVHQYLFQDGTLAGMAALERIGPLVSVETTVCTAGGTGRDDAGLRDLVAEVLPHPLSVLERMVPGGIGDRTWQVVAPRAGELRAQAGAGSVALAVHVSAAGRPTRNALTATGERGTLHLDFFHGFGVVEGGAVSRARKVVRPFALAGGTAARASVNLARRGLRAEPAYPGLRMLIAAFYAAARGEAEAPIAPAEVEAVAEARDRLTAAAGQGRVTRPDD